MVPPLYFGFLYFVSLRFMTNLAFQTHHCGLYDLVSLQSFSLWSQNHNYIIINVCCSGSLPIPVLSWLPPTVPPVICPWAGIFSTSPGISWNLENKHFHILLLGHAITFRTPNSSLTLSLLENWKCLKNITKIKNASVFLKLSFKF